jgi:hypothetical protein
MFALFYVSYQLVTDDNIEDSLCLVANYIGHHKGNVEHGRRLFVYFAFYGEWIVLVVFDLQ